MWQKIWNSSLQESDWFSTKRLKTWRSPTRHITAKIAATPYSTPRSTDAAKLVRQMAPQREGEALAQVKKLGMKVNEIDTAPLVKAAIVAQDELAKEFGAEKLLEQIRKTR